MWAWAANPSAPDRIDGKTPPLVGCDLARIQYILCAPSSPEPRDGCTVRQPGRLDSNAPLVLGNVAWESSNRRVQRRPAEVVT